MNTPRPCIGKQCFTVSASESESRDNSIYRVFFNYSSALFEDRHRRPSPFVPPVYLAVGDCGG